ncbi:RagB/SusD family nutrient uptake outer membrane protein [uncultured Bacteroides sp.]|uniref:RagB/SusD family nutrient uptake outer membrane protein n=1 Tax=uncultured Bacteroides sp. TaxID=162156 RepID=UPI002AABF79E|nr:RagB/SusD family nutrient uptake outer membrane protein [uncultured Bacteroides sp.]
MKRNIILFLAIITGGLFTGCTGSWLDTVKEGTPTESNYWSSDDDFESAATSLYYCLSLEETWGRNLFWEQGASDDIFFSRTRGSSQMNLANLAMDGDTEGSIKDIYDEMYTTMSIANNIIYHALLIDENNRSAIVNRTLGEAYFMRAFSHFMIAYRYGRLDNGVPFERYEDFTDYINQLNQMPPQQSSVTDNYAYIIEDLQSAAALLPWFTEYNSDNYGRPSKEAAYGYMVKTYAYWAQHDASKWALIPDLVDKIESDGGRGLLNNFADVFKIENNWSKEYIWSVNSSASNYAGSIFPGIVLDNKGWGAYNGWGNFKPTLELWAEYSDEDARRSATIMQYGDEFTYFGTSKKFYSTADNECGFHFRKYMEPFSYGNLNGDGVGENNPHVSTNGDRPSTDLNLPLMRFSELLLFKAEALIMQGKNALAATPLNRIASRANENVVYTSPTMMDLMHERRCELACEFTDRLMDLKRWSAEGTSDWNLDALAKIKTAKHGIKHVKRSNPESAIDTTNGTTEVINGKTYQGVFELANMSAKAYAPGGTYSVLPYEINQVIKSNGALIQNSGYASN